MSRRGQRGVAVVTAILIVAVAASAAVYLLAQQSAMLSQVSLVASRAQADFYADAGLDWARALLAEDARRNAVDTLAEDWSKPLVGLPVERAVVSGAIADAQARFNLNNLVRDGRSSEPDVRHFRRLLAALGLEEDLAHAVADWIDADGDLAGPGGAEDAFYLALPRPHRAANRPLAQVEELYRVRGFDAAAVARLRPHVTALPARTPVNANTATVEVMAALLAPMDRGDVQRLLASREAKPFRDKADLAGRAT